MPSFYLVLIQHVKSNSNSNKRIDVFSLMVHLKEIKGTDKITILCNTDVLMKARNAEVCNAYIF